jgi:predicted CXXCH cytochrome family protein
MKGVGRIVMVEKSLSNYTKRVASVSQLCLIMLATFVSVSWGVELENAAKSECSFSTYLADSHNRARYENLIARGRYRYNKVNNNENAAIYVAIAKSGYGVEHIKNLDSFSAGCLACHDGKSASKIRPAIMNSPDKKSVMGMISAKHPIGMDYEKYSVTNKSLKSLDEMSRNLSLSEGRVGCITCHDPLNSGRNHLRITKTGVDLCSACHNV